MFSNVPSLSNARSFFSHTIASLTRRLPTLGLAAALLLSLPLSAFGAVTVPAGYTASTYATLESPPAGITVDLATRTIYLADQSQYPALRRINPSTRAVETVNADITVGAQPANSMVYDFSGTDIQFRDGKVYVVLSSGAEGELREVDVTTIGAAPTILATTPSLTGYGLGAGLTIDKTGRIYFTSGTGTARKFGTYDGTVDPPTLDASSVSNLPASPLGLEFAPFTNAFIFAKSGSGFYNIVPGPGGSFTAIAASAPTKNGNFAIDPSGTSIYARVEEAGVPKIIKIAISTGTYTTFATGLSTYSPSDIAFGPASTGNGWSLYVTEESSLVEIAGDFTGTPAPTLTNVQPSSGPLSNSASGSVTLTGTNLQTAHAVFFGGIAGLITGAPSATTVTVTPPDHAAGTVDVRVVTNGGFATRAASYSFGDAPTISTITPNQGPEVGGQVVTITGTNFLGATTVTFGGNAATAVTVNSSTQITATTPAHGPGLVDVVVTSAGGGVTAAQIYEYFATPTVTSITPNAGPLGGGQTVTIVGNHFLAVTSVSFGGSLGTVTASTDTEITVTTPVHAAGAVNVVITSTGGTATVTSGYTYVNPPTITLFLPLSGSINGGTEVTITGTNLSNPRSVTFGGTEATNVTASANSITATTPPHRGGAFKVAVTTWGGTATSTQDFTFTAPAPTIATINPNSGSTAGNQTVVITGTNLRHTESVTFGGTAALTITQDSDTQVTVTAPPHAAGAVNVVLTTSGNNSVTSTNGYTYTLVPGITSISPNAGKVSGGDTVTLTGQNLQNTMSSGTVTFGGVNATFVSNSSSTQIVVNTPAAAGAGKVDVVVTNPSGTTTVVDGFEYANAPTATNIDKVQGPASGGQQVVITGTNLQVTTSVSFGGTNGTIQNKTATSVTVLTPAHAAGSFDVDVNTAAGTARVPVMYEFIAAPTITSIAPNTGKLEGGQTITINGTGLLTTSSIKIDGAEVTPQNQTTTSVQFVTPAHAAASVNVEVTTIGGSVTSTNGFRYVALPTITNINPSSGSTTGTQNVTITGTNFVAPIVVKFDGVTAPVQSGGTETSITVTRPAHADGTVDVVLSAAGGEVTAAGAYTYESVPAITGIDPPAGPIGGAQSVTITGTDLALATSVTFDGTAANITGRADNAVTVATPAHAAGNVNVVVNTPGGQITSTNGYRYVNAPTITSVVPIHGPAEGGQSVAINGTNLDVALSATFGGAAANIGTKTAAQLTVTTTAREAGLVDVIVTTYGGTVTRSSGYTFIDAPVVTDIQPAKGKVAGNQVITFTGANFANTSSLTTTVTFGGVAGTILTNSGTSMTVRTPAHAADLVDVVITASGDPDGRTFVDAFEFVDIPTVTSVAPESGPATGGTVVTITGTNLIHTTSVLFGSTAVTPTSTTATSVTVTAPSHDSGFVDITVQTPGGTASLPGAYNYTLTPAPTVTSIAPNEGPTAGGQQVVITGTNLTAASSVKFAGTAGTIQSVTETAITLLTPARATTGKVTVVVTTPGGTVTKENFYEYFAPPTITTVAPVEGPVAGDQSVTITGTNLAGASVTFGTTAAPAPTSSSATEIVVKTPAHSAGTVGVTVTHVGGSATKPNAYRFAPLPDITGISPTAGPTGGGQTVTINGTGFTGATSVTFDGASVTFTVTSDTAISATTNAHAAGLVDVIVTTAGGADTLAGTYRFAGTPDITSITPNAGRVSGGQTLTIAGTELWSVSAITFGGVSGQITTSNGTSATVVTPGHGAGAVDVVITAAGGSDTTTNGFTYVAAPVITNISPTSGPIAGSQRVTITGSNLGSASVTFGGSLGSLFTNSDTEILVDTPAHAAGEVAVVVSTVGGNATSPTPYTYLGVPDITGVSPDAGPLGGGQQVTITGAHLANATVRFDGTTVLPTANTATSITVTSPADEAGPIQIAVTTNGGSDSATYTYVGAPTVQTVSPANGPAGGGQSVTITGTNFNNTTSVTFGGTAGVITANTPTSLTVTTQGHVAGTVDVVVTAAGGSVTKPASYTFLPGPVITTVSPSSGPATGSQVVTINGSDLGTATSVTFGGSNAAITNVTETSLTVTTPAHAAGLVTVVVTTSGGTATGTDKYTFLAPPAITAVSPNMGSTAGNQQVTISGTNLANPTSVTFGGTAATVTNSTATSITISTPPHAAGAVNVVVTTNGGTVTANNAYTYATSLATPIAFTATATSSTQASLSWNAVAGATFYEVIRGPLNGPFSVFSTSATTYTDSTLSANSAYLYRVRAIGNGLQSSYTAHDPVSTVIFTDAVLTGVAAKRLHITELRTAVNALRVAAGLSNMTFTDSTLTAGVSPIRTVHISELRTALNGARSAIGLPALTYTDATLTAGSTVMKGAHLTELRNGVK